MSWWSMLHCDHLGFQVLDFLDKHSLYRNSEKFHITEMRKDPSFYRQGPCSLCCWKSLKSEQSHNLPSSWNPSHPSPFNPELRIPPFPIQDPGFHEAPHSQPFCRVLALLWGEGALELLLSISHYPQPSSFPWILVPERWSHTGQEGVSDPQINTSVGKLRAEWSVSVQAVGELGVPCSQLWPQLTRVAPALSWLTALFRAAIGSRDRC